MVDLYEVLNSDRRVVTGNLFISQGDLDTSLKMFESALDADPKNISALCNGAFVLLKMKNFWRADGWIKTALELQPEHPHALGIAALVAQETPGGDFAAAQAFFEQSLANDPNNITTLLNYGYMLQLVGDFKRGLEIYTRARNLDVMNLNTRFQRSMCMLTLAETQTEWREALDEYEIRHLLYNNALPRERARPMYTGSEDSQRGDETLLIIKEQGIGDMVMTARYVRHLKLNCIFRRVYMLVRPGWEELFQCVRAIDGVWSDIAKVPPFDFWVPALSLLRVRNWPQVQPSTTPYLRSDSMAAGYEHPWRIGLCWRGNPEHGNDRWRSIPAELFCNTFAGLDNDYYPHVGFYSLQQAEHNTGKPDFVREMEIHTLDRLADLISDMDLVITVDTAILHIAGALGVPVFALIASNPDWRWGVNTQVTPWYPSVTLFRAVEPLGWQPVLERVRAEVNLFMNERWRKR